MAIFKSLLVISLMLLNTSIINANELTQEKNNPRIVSLNWTHTEIFLSLGIVPLGVAQITDYNTWVQSPKIPASVSEIGLRSQPNMELLFELQPDSIFISPMSESLMPKLERVAPVHNISLYDSGKFDWHELTAVTKKIATAVSKSQEASQLIKQAEIQLAKMKQNLSADMPPLLIISLMDKNHVRVFGDNSLYQAAIDQLGLTNAWEGATNAWGFNLIGIDKLIDIKAQIIVVDPMPVGTQEYLNTNQLWQYIVKQSGNPIIHLPAVWSIGAIPSALRFASLVHNALTEEMPL